MRKKEWLLRLHQLKIANWIDQESTEASSFGALNALNTSSFQDVVALPYGVHCDYMYMANYAD